MSRLIHAVIILGISLSSYSFQKNSVPVTQRRTGIKGQVYAVGAPAVRIDWKPPPLERISTIIITDSTGKTVKEIKTDTKGKFTTSLPPGIYYFLVKESIIERNDGPFTVKKNRITDVQASFDNGVR